jgi:hypothetical protein
MLAMLPLPRYLSTESKVRLPSPIGRGAAPALTILTISGSSSGRSFLAQARMVEMSLLQAKTKQLKGSLE